MPRPRGYPGAHQQPRAPSLHPCTYRLVSISRHPNVSSQPVFREFLGLTSNEALLAAEAASLTFHEAEGGTGATQGPQGTRAPGQPQQPTGAAVAAGSPTVLPQESGIGGTGAGGVVRGLGVPGGVLGATSAAGMGTPAAAAVTTPVAPSPPQQPQPDVTLQVPFGAPGAVPEVERVTLHAPHVMEGGEFTATGVAEAPPHAGDEVASAEAAVELRLPPARAEEPARRAIEEAQRAIDDTRTAESAAAALARQADDVSSAAARQAVEANAAEARAAAMTDAEARLAAEARESAAQAEALTAAAAERRAEAVSKAAAAASTRTEAAALHGEAGACAMVDAAEACVRGVWRQALSHDRCPFHCPPVRPTLMLQSAAWASTAPLWHVPPACARRRAPRTPLRSVSEWRCVFSAFFGGRQRCDRWSYRNSAHLALARHVLAACRPLPTTSARAVSWRRRRARSRRPRSERSTGR